jgi:hypothetical protein
MERCECGSTDLSQAYEYSRSGGVLVSDWFRFRCRSCGAAWLRGVDSGRKFPDGMLMVPPLDLAIGNTSRTAQAAP